MRIWSNDFEHEGMIPTKFSCDDTDISPHLQWDGVPPEAKSLALIMDDPDAPRGTWVHWLVCDIDPKATGSQQNSIPPNGRQVNNDFRKPGYGGPCPPSGVHRYFFKLYALDVTKLKANDKAAFYDEVKKHHIARALVMGKYKRK